MSAKSESQKKWYEKNKERHKANVAIRKARMVAEARAFVQELKSTNPCTDCGFMYPYYVMDFDHIGDDKERIVSKLVVEGYGIERIQREIDKCELVCSNCHRERTFTRGQHGISINA